MKTHTSARERVLNLTGATQPSYKAIDNLDVSMNVTFSFPQKPI